MTATATARDARPAAQVLAAAAARLAAAGVATATLDARVLLAEVLGGAGEVVARAREPLAPAALARYEAMVVRRVAREPVAYIVGRREFWSLELVVTPDVLIPRPESEEVVAAVLDRVGDRARAERILDIGTGSGCLLLALLSELPGASGVGVDASAAALTVARLNARRLGLASRTSFACMSWGEAVNGRFDVLVSNPPYVATEDAGSLAPEILRHEPQRALFAGPDGLDAYRAIAPQVRGLLAPGGIAAFEIGASQADAVASILAEAGLGAARRRNDLAGRPRCLIVAPDGEKNLGIVGDGG